MNRDLIKRGDVLDALEKVFYDYNMAWDKYGGFAKAVPDAIKGMPTAFDLEGVIKQVKEKGTKVCYSVKCNGNCENCEHGILMKSIIEILKSATTGGLKC